MTASKIWSCMLLVSAAAVCAASQPMNPELLKVRWPAYWISHPEASLTDYGVFHFRRTFTLETVPGRFIVHVSADNRYKLYVNGTFAGMGPARGDLKHWRFETFDIASFLKRGENVVAAVVWNFGDRAPWAQITSKTAFLLQGDGEAEGAINSNDSWRVTRNRAYAPFETPGRYLHVVGPGERIDARLYPWGWQRNGFDDSEWLPARPLFRAVPHGTRRYSCPWTLVPRALPAMEHNPQRLRRIARSAPERVPEGFLDGGADWLIPAGTSCSVLCDMGVLTNAYVHLEASGGRDAEIVLTYSEALYDSRGGKGHRDEIEGREIRGARDLILFGGGGTRHFETLWFRTYRYLQLDITTGEQPLTLHDLYGQFTAYPFEQAGAFQSDDPSLERIWRVGWRTQRLCAGETYYDCPYYEQLQYAGDTRIQTFITCYVAEDDRLMRRALLDFDQSRFADGLTQSRYPNRITQTIPPYSLFWIAMIHDYWMLRDDPGFVQRLLPGIDAVLSWFERRIDPALNMLGPVEWWNFVDWTPEYPHGVPPGIEDGGSAIVTLQYAYALDYAAELAAVFKLPERAARYRTLSDEVKRGVIEHCWDQVRGLVADSPQRTLFSQHANIMAILTDAIPVEQQADVLQKVLDDPGLVQATFYYRFYLFRALEHVGWGDRVVSQMDPWRDMIDMGLTTFAEKPEPTRSDCHAWSACPVYEFLATVCGIKPASPGFRTVLIEPHPGYLREFRGTAVHPHGRIRVDLKRRGESGLEGTVDLPRGVSGQIRWNGSSLLLRDGVQKVRF